MGRLAALGTHWKSSSSARSITLEYPWKGKRPWGRRGECFWRIWSSLQCGIVCESDRRYIVRVVSFLGTGHSQKVVAQSPADPFNFLIGASRKRREIGGGER